MINRVCDLCGEYVSDVWVLVISDEKDNKSEFSGCKSCIDNLDNQHKSIKGVGKMSLDKVLKHLNLKKES